MPQFLHFFPILFPVFGCWKSIAVNIPIPISSCTCAGVSPGHSLGKCFEPQAHRKKCIFTMTQYTTPQTCCLHTLLKQFYYIMNNKGK